MLAPPFVIGRRAAAENHKTLRLFPDLGLCGEVHGAAQANVVWQQFVCLLHERRTTNLYTLIKIVFTIPVCFHDLSEEESLLQQR